MEQQFDLEVLLKLKRKRRRKNWKRIVGAMMCLVVFCTTYMLILPAITKETDTFCGIEEHTHSEACYEKVLLCENHVHTLECYGSTPEQLICTEPVDDGHAHSEACSPVTETKLTCEKEEAEGHIHNEACNPVTQNNLTCGKEEMPGHVHTEGCAPVTQAVLSCALEENEAHTHDSSCYTEQTTYGCGLAETEGHTHDETCNTEQTTYGCGLEQVEPHTHAETCHTEITTYGCGLEEVPPSHTHAGACYTLICTLDATADHEHANTCYGEKLTCEKPEHTHDLACYADLSADLESAAGWEATLPELTGDYSQDVLAIAQSQLGYTESTRNYIVDENGDMKGYTRYGAWYGIPYGDWCAMFVSFCMHYADVEEIPTNAHCPSWVEQLQELDLYKVPSEYVPEAGDIIFFDWENDGCSDHVGLVTAFSPETETSTAKVQTIEGNSGDTVRYNTYNLADPTIVGYGILPTFPATGKTLTATIYTDGTYAELSEDETVITVQGELPENAVVKAFPVQLENNELNTLCVYDIEIFLEDGSLYVHEGDPLKVNFSSARIDAVCQDLVEPEVYFIPEEGEPEQIDTVVEEGTVTFETPHFSVYALVVRGETIPVNNQQALEQAWNTVVNAGSGVIQLTADMTVNRDASLILNSGNAHVIVDLNGYTLTHTGGASLFQVQNGQLTLGDSVIAEETITEQGTVSVNSLQAHVATAQEANGKVNLTYYVTESEVNDPENGGTIETLYQHKVTSTGTILANASAPLITVNGGTLNIEGGTYYGGTQRGIYQTGGTTNILDGYICGFTRAEPGNVNGGNYAEVEHSFGGAVWSTGNDTVLNLYGGVLAGNKAASGGAIYVNNGTLNLDGSTISGNTSTVIGNNEKNNEGLVHFGGGGIYTRGSAEVNAMSGYITNNLARSVCYFDGGGGILLDDTSVMTIDGGYFTGNEAASGGAIRTNWQRNVFLDLNGGYFCANYGRTAEGGAISINQYANAYIRGGYYNNNRTDNVTHWGGGALFGANGSRVYLESALITENSAGGFGGGLAGCSTGRVEAAMGGGGAAFNNTAAGENMSGSESDKREDTIYAYGDPVFMSNGYADFFCALNSVIDGSMLGGFPANWTGSADGHPVEVAAKDRLHSAYVVGLTAHPTMAGMDAARDAATSFFNGNYSNTHGGGILCNGYMVFGQPIDVVLGSRLQLEGTKELVGEDGAYLSTDEDVFKFEIVDAHTNEHVAYGTNDKNGNIHFDHRLPFTAPGVYTYLVREIPADNTTITYDTTQYRVTVTVTTFHDTITVAGETLPRTWHQISNVTVERYDGTTWTQLSSVDPPDSDDSATVISLSAGATFTNLQLEKKDITVVKKWEGQIPNMSVTVRLMQNGQQYGNAVVLNDGNNWTYTWHDLPVYVKDEEGNITGTYYYNVVEDDVPGYWSNYEITNSSEVREYWIPAYYLADELVPGERYMIAYQDSRGNNQVMTIKSGENVHLNSGDRDVVNKGTGSIQYNGQTIVDYFSTTDTDERSVFRAVEMTTGEGHEGIVLQNMGTGTAFLVEPSNGHYLKTSSGWGMGNGWYSRFFYDGNILYGNYIRSNTGKWVVTYEEVYNNGVDVSLFDVSSVEDAKNYAKLYVLVPAGASVETTVTITNTPEEKILYEMDLTKVNSRDHDVKLAGAVFNLMQDENLLSFIQEAPGAYRLSNAEGAVTDLVTNNSGKLVLKDLPAGDYLLKETKAPIGYLLMKDTSIRLPDDLAEGQLSLKLTLEDNPESSYELPETGGAGTQLYTTAGLLLMLTSAAFLMYKLRKRRKEVV